MSKPVIKAEGISKAYQLGEFSTGTLSRDIERWWAKVRGKEDPFLRIGQINDRTKGGKADIVWSLKDINFEIAQGSAVGIIGRNGAGKSTLLKVLSRVTTPTTGSIKIKGRVASLLEVGTGFHPELTGRENIYLNGAILGMRKTEIKRQFDAIVDFAGVERYVDTPVKRYSSGMYVRLAFAVAAHLDSEILVVDEVLAVGDAEFQKKCLGKMGEVSQSQGRTVLFVSHNMNSIMSLCETSILLSQGQVEAIGKSSEVINEYLEGDNSVKAGWTNHDKQQANPYFTLQSIQLVDNSGQFLDTGIVANNQESSISLTFNVQELHPDLTVGIAVYSKDNQLLFWSYHIDKPKKEWISIKKGINSIRIRLPQHLLNEGEYFIKPLVSLHFIQWILNPDNPGPMIKVAVVGGLSNSPRWVQARPGLLAPILDYSLESRSVNTHSVY